MAEESSVALAETPRPAASPPARRLLLDAARRRFAREGPHAPTLEDIRRDAGVSVGALYHHFPDRAALASELYVEILGDYQEGLLTTLGAHPTAEDGVRAVVRYTLERCLADRERTAVLLAGREGVDPEVLARLNRPFLRAVRAWWRAHADAGELRDLDPALADALWLGPARAWLEHRLAGRARGSREAAIAALSDAAWAAASNPGAALRKPDTEEPE